MPAKVRVRAIPNQRYGIDDANGMRLFTARLVEVGDRDDPRVRLDKIKLKAGKDVLLGGQVVLANHSSTLEAMKVVLDAPSLRLAFGLEADAAYGVDPSVEVYFLPGHDEARKIGSSGLISDDVDHDLKDALLELRALKRQHDGVAKARAPQHVLSTRTSSRVPCPRVCAGPHGQIPPALSC